MVRLTYEEVKYFIEVKSASGCKLISKEYINCKNKLEIQCACGELFKTRFDQFKSGKRTCNKCSNKYRSRNYALRYDDVKYYVEVESKSGCKLLSKEYINNNTDMLFQCKCGNEFKTLYRDFRYNNKRRCNECGAEAIGDSLRFSYDYVKYYVEVESGSKCKLLSEEYLGNKEKLQIQCKCGNIFETSWACFKYDHVQQCKSCSLNVSKGELIILEYLNDFNINYKTEYWFDNLKGNKNKPLQFDFAVFNQSNNLLFLIEYDGEQHFEPIDFAGKGKEWAKENFKCQRQNDNLKNQYCKNNNIPLLRIPYWEFDSIEQILDEWLSEYGLIHSENIKEIVQAINIK